MTRTGRYAGAVLACLSAIGVGAQQPDIVLLTRGDAEVRVVDATAAPGSDVAWQAFDEFAQGRNFVGAFASAAGGAYGWSTGRLSVENARVAALQNCAAHGRPCRVYAILAPAGLHDSLSMIASPLMMLGLGDMLEQPQVHAVAASPSGVFGTAWGWSSPEEAAVHAMGNCRGRLGEPTSPAEQCRIVQPVFAPE